MYVVDIKNSRYSIDIGLAKAIGLREGEKTGSPNLVGKVV
jgi:hypothetical protein